MGHILGRQVVQNCGPINKERYTYWPLQMENGCREIFINLGKR